MGVGIAVEDDLVDEVGTVEVGVDDNLAPTDVNAFGQVDAIVPGLFHLGRVEEANLSCRGHHGGVLGQDIRRTIAFSCRGSNGQFVVGLEAYVQTRRVEHLLVIAVIVGAEACNHAPVVVVVEDIFTENARHMLDALEGAVVKRFIVVVVGITGTNRIFVVFVHQIRIEE